MKKFVFLALFCSLLFSSVNADDITGEMVYARKLKNTCHVKGDFFSKKHTQQEWKTLYESGKLFQEIEKNCPDIESIKEEHLNHLFEFLFKYAKDTDKIPLC